VAQLVTPLGVYTVGMVGLNETQLGHLMSLNGAMVVLFQLPITRLTDRYRLTTLLAFGAVLYFVGYAMMGTLVGFWWFMLLIFVVTIGELLISPPTMTLTSRLAPPGRTGRYMGVYGFFVTLGWSLGPLYGGAILDLFQHDWMHAWWLISSLAFIAAIGYIWFSKWLPKKVNEAQALLDDD
jgi:MFS family permease